jgi:hypothetical protein
MKTRVIVAGVFLGMLGASSFAAERDVFKAQLRGANEVPPVVTDTNGRFEVSVNRTETAAEYTLRINNGVRITQAHFHCGPEGVNGPVIVFLAGFRPEGWDVDGKWISNATITDANVINTTCGATLEAIFAQARSGNVYVNAHSVEHPGGVVRGQLLPTDDKD